jgi:branched-chain amino acid transport system permease protein
LSFRYGLRGSYFALVTLAFAEVLRILASSFQITGGGQGILVPYKAGIANFQFADRISTYTLVLTMVAVAMLITFAVQRSRFGAYLIAIRENEEAAKALGIDTFRTKVLAMMLSGAIGGAAGVAYLQTYLFIDAPIAYGSTMSIEALLGPIIGGAGTLWGPLVGTLILHLIGESAKHLVSGAPGLNLVLYGVVLLVILRYLPSGIVGLARTIGRPRRSTAPSVQEATPC